MLLCQLTGPEDRPGHADASEPPTQRVICAIGSLQVQGQIMAVPAGDEGLDLKLERVMDPQCL